MWAAPPRQPRRVPEAAYGARAHPGCWRALSQPRAPSCADLSGSNIFDVCFGLPFPWILFNIVMLASDCKLPVLVKAGDQLFISLVVLLCMVALIVVTIGSQGWKMTKTLGLAMFFFYFIYLAIALATTPPKNFASPKC